MVKVISHSIKSGTKSTYFMHNYGLVMVATYYENDYLCTVYYFYFICFIVGTCQMTVAL